MRTTSFSAADYIPEPAREFLARRAAEVSGLALLCGAGATALALASWSVQDPSLNHATAGPIRNLLGDPGAIVADLVMQMVGLASIAMLVPMLFWGWRLLTRRRLEKARMRIILGIVGTAAFSGLVALLPVTDRWPLPTGLGGVVGDAVLALPRHISGGTGLTMLLTALALSGIALLSPDGILRLRPPERRGRYELRGFAGATEPKRPLPREEEDAVSDPGFGLVTLGALIHAVLSMKAAIRRHFRASPPLPTTASSEPSSRTRRRTARAGALRRRSRSASRAPDDRRPKPKLPPRVLEGPIASARPHLPCEPAAARQRKLSPRCSTATATNCLRSCC